MLRSICCFIALTFGTLSLSAQELLLRLGPDVNALVVKRTNVLDPIVKRAKTITNAEMAQQGWMQSSKRVQMEGYLAADKLAKNFEIEINAKVYPTSDLSGSALTRVQSKDSIKLLEVEDAWSRIQIEKEMPIYFQVTTTRAPLKIYVPPFQEAALAAKRTRIAPQGPMATVRPDQLPPKNVAWTGSDNASLAAPSLYKTFNTTSTARAQMRTSPNSSPAPAPAPAPADGRIYRLSGKLIRAISDEAPRYSLRLEDSFGSTVAYVDVSQLYIEDLRQLTNQPVHIHGEVHPLAPNADALVIVARTVRVGN